MGTTMDAPISSGAHNSTTSAFFGSGGALAGLLPEVQTVEVLVAVSIFVVIHSLRQRRSLGLPSWPVVGMLPSLLLGVRGDMYEWITGVLKARGGTFTFRGPWFTNLHCVVTADPRNLEHLLKTKFGNFPEGPYFRDTVRDLLGDGIFGAGDEVWCTQRKAASLEFHSAEFRALTASSLVELVHRRLLPVLAETEAAGAAVDLQDVLLRLCLLADGVLVGPRRTASPPTLSLAQRMQRTTARASRQGRRTEKTASDSAPRLVALTPPGARRCRWSEGCLVRPCLQCIDAADAQGDATVFVADFFGRTGLLFFLSAVSDDQPRRGCGHDGDLYGHGGGCGASDDPDVARGCGAVATRTTLPAWPSTISIAKELEQKLIVTETALAPPAVALGDLHHGRSSPSTSRRGRYPEDSATSLADIVNDDDPPARTAVPRHGRRRVAPGRRPCPRCRDSCRRGRLSRRRRPQLLRPQPVPGEGRGGDFFLDTASFVAMCLRTAHGKEQGTGPRVSGARRRRPSLASSSSGTHPWALPCPRHPTHGKELFPVQFSPVWSLPCVAHGNDFAVCFWAFAV